MVWTVLFSSACGTDTLVDLAIDLRHYEWLRLAINIGPQYIT